MIQLSGATEYVFKMIESGFCQDVNVVEHNCFSKPSILRKAKYAEKHWAVVLQVAYWQMGSAMHVAVTFRMNKLATEETNVTATII